MFRGAWHQPLQDGELRYWPQAFSADEAAHYLAALRHSLAWQNESVIIFGEARPVPRLIAWYGEREAVYTYSGVKHVPKPFTAELTAIRKRIESLASAQFNSALANLYRNGRDGMGWHADNEPELGRNPVIASVSFGQARRFTMKHRRRKTLKHAIDLEPGSLLVMEGGTQHHWLHALPKTTRPIGERLNLTYRWIKAQR